MIYKCKYFKIYELVPPEIYKKVSENIIWLSFFDNRILVAADKLRERYGKAIINNWRYGGDRKYSGYRPPECKVGSVYSLHKFGRALDIIFEDVTAQEVRNDLKDKVIVEIARIENAVPWLHIDSANYREKGIYFFNV